MGQSQLNRGELSVSVRNIGGIDETTVDLRTGVNVLAGRNATNRTSFLRALMGALGSDRLSLKADADAGAVTLRTPTDSYSRRLERTGESVALSGEPYLDDPTVGDLFAFLLESNDARQAVARSENLRELIMKPVDTDEIQAEIESAVAEKRRLDERIEELADLETELPALEADREAVEGEIAEIEADLEAKRAALDEMDGSIEATQAENEAIEATFEQLQSIQSDLEERRFRRETEQESIETLRAEREEIIETLEGLPETSETERERIERRLETARRRRSELDSTTSQLQSVIQFNEEMLEGTNPAITEALRVDSTETAPTDQLTGDEEIVCWTCGSEVDTSDIESTLERLKRVRQEKLAERRELRTEIDSLTEQQRTLESAAERREQLERKRERTADEIETRSERVDALTDEIDSLREEASELESEIESHEQSKNTELLDRHTEINDLEFDLGRKETERQQLEDRIETIEATLDRREHLQADRETVAERLTRLRTRIDDLEADAVAAFNEHMDAVLETLGYENLARIWIERSTETRREGRQTVEASVFRLHIVRQGDDGRTYEDRIDHLSESEREVTGLVFALAGYLVHDVYEEIPIMILDSLEAIDSNRIAALVEYFSEYVETIVVALLPEDAQALDDAFHRVTEI